MCARREYPLAKKVASTPGYPAQVVLWESGDDVLAAVKALVAELAPPARA